MNRDEPADLTSMMRVLISGGPGSGCTSTAAKISERTGIPVFDSDAFFHKPTDPPFQEQYSREERRAMVSATLAQAPHWLLSGSIATWGVDFTRATHGVFLNVPALVRVQRLLERQRSQFGDRIDPGGDMHSEHEAFIEWAAAYEERTGISRCLVTDREFVRAHCDKYLSIDEVADMETIVEAIMNFLSSE